MAGAIEYGPSSVLLRKVVRVAVNEGPRGIWRRALDKFRSKFAFTRHFLLAYPIHPEMDVPRAKVPFTVERVYPEDTQTIDEMVAIYGVPTRAEALLERLCDAKYCYVARVDGRLGGYVWIHHSGAVKEYGKTILRLKPDEVYNHDVYVVPEQRGKRIYPALKAYCARQIAREFGKKRMVSYVRRDNHNSLSSSRKLGEYREGWLGQVKLFGRRFPYVIRHRPVPLREEDYRSFK